MSNVVYVICGVIVIVIVTLYNSCYSQEHFSGQLRVADELDHKRAMKYALKKMCEENGYVWKEFPGSEFVYDCKHTKSTCLSESVYPTQPNHVPQYYEWRSAVTEDYKSVASLESTSGLLSGMMNQSTDYKRQDDIQSNDGICILGAEPFRKFCEDEKLSYNTDTGRCVTTKEYCLPKLMAFCKNDCFETPTRLVLSKVFGTTLGRTLGSSSLIDTAIMAACE